jgi:hypothetical protein
MDCGRITGPSKNNNYYYRGIHMFDKFKKKKESGMKDIEKTAKTSVIQALRDMAEGEMSGKLKGLKKVTVASDSEHGLEKGLEKAKEIMGMSDDTETEEDGIEDAEMPEMPVADDDDALPEDELNAKLEKLMKMKEKFKAKA